MLPAWAGEKVSPLAVEYRPQGRAGTDENGYCSTTPVGCFSRRWSWLCAAGEADEAKEVAARIAKIDEQLDAELKKTAVPFKTEPFKDARGRAERVAVVELFTECSLPAVRLGRRCLRRRRQNVQAKRRGAAPVSPARPRPRCIDQPRLGEAAGILRR